MAAFGVAGYVARYWWRKWRDILAEEGRLERGGRLVVRGGGQDDTIQTPIQAQRGGAEGRVRFPGGDMYGVAVPGEPEPLPVGAAALTDPERLGERERRVWGVT